MPSSYSTVFWFLMYKNYDPKHKGSIHPGFYLTPALQHSWNPLDIPGNPWIYLKPPGYPWKPLDIFKTPWISLHPLDIPVTPCISLEPPGYPWHPLDIPGTPWISLEPPGTPWISVEPPGYPRTPCRAPCQPTHLPPSYQVFSHISSNLSYSSWNEITLLQVQDP